MDTPLDATAPDGEHDAPDDRPSREEGCPAGAFPALPLLHRIVLANALVVAVGAVVGTAVSVQVGRNWSGGSTALLAAAFGGAGLFLSLLVNGLLVRWLLSPLERLERAAERIQAGGEPVDEEVVVPATADPSLRRLVDVFNAMLSSLARYRARLRRLAARSLEAREDERVRLSRILQEDTAQQLATALLQLRSARRRDDDGGRDRALDELRDDLGATLESVRRLARSLRPPELDDLGLGDALRALARETRERGGPDVRITITGDDVRLPGETRLTLYRAVQAALRAHGHGSRPEARGLHLSLERRSDHVVVEVGTEDDGASFALSRPGRDGAPARELFAMREWARFSGGEVSVRRDPRGEATAVRIRLPLDPGAAPFDAAGASPRSTRSPTNGRKETTR